MQFANRASRQDANDAATLGFVARVIEARMGAVNAMAALTCDGKEGTPAYRAAANLEADMQRMLHGGFEV